MAYRAYTQPSASFAGLLYPPFKGSLRTALFLQAQRHLHSGMCVQERPLAAGFAAPQHGQALFRSPVLHATQRLQPALEPRCLRHFFRWLPAQTAPVSQPRPAHRHAP